MQCNKTSDPDESSSSDEYDYVIDPNASEELAVYQHSGVSLTYLHVCSTVQESSRFRASAADHEHSTSDDDITPKQNKKGPIKI